MGAGLCEKQPGEKGRCIKTQTPQGPVTWQQDAKKNNVFADTFTDEVSNKKQLFLQQTRPTKAKLLLETGTQTGLKGDC